MSTKKSVKKQSEMKTEAEINSDEIPFKIPDNWKWVKLGNILEIARGGSPRPIKKYLTDSEDGINWIKISDADKNGKYINYTKEKIIKEGISRSRFVHCGDFLLTNSMSFGRPYILNTDGCIHDGWLVLSKYDLCYNKDFLFYLLSSQFAYRQFSSMATGSVVKNLSTDKVENSIFPLPPLEEQKLIAAKIESEFQKIDNALNKLNIIKDQIKQYKQSVLKYAFDENNSFAKGSNYEPYEWEEKILNDIIDKSKNAIKRGPFGSSLKKEFFVENGIRVFEQYNPINNDPYWCRYRITKEKYEELKEFKCKEGDFLISCSGTMGKIIELPNGVEEGIINQALLKITIDRNIINNRYFVFLFRSPKFQNKILGTARGAAIQNIASVKELKNIKIKLPNIELQKTIADNIQNIFDKVDNIENNINENIDKLNVLKQAVLKKAFEGKLI